jgi:hypothetical protein
MSPENQNNPGAATESEAGDPSITEAESSENWSNGAAAQICRMPKLCGADATTPSFTLP